MAGRGSRVIAGSKNEQRWYLQVVAGSKNEQRRYLQVVVAF
jgi:hypothetical protein